MYCYALIFYRPVGGCSESRAQSEILFLGEGKVLKDDPVKVEQLKTSMYLALWATQCTLSFEDFVKRLSRNLI